MNQLIIIYCLHWYNSGKKANKACDEDKLAEKKLEKEKQRKALAQKKTRKSAKKKPNDDE